MTATLEAPRLPPEVASRTWQVMPDTFAMQISERGWMPAKHHALMAYMLYLCRIGFIKRLIVNQPPGSGKSEMVSRWFPAWSIEQDPSTRIILASYEALLAEEWGKQVRAVFQEHTEDLTTRLRQDSQASNRWRTTGMGGMWTTGTGGSITGRRARFFVIDDPHKNFAEAHSETNRESVWNWYTSTARTRLLPGGTIINCQTRWHEDDLTGRMLERSHAGGVPWVQVRLPAIAVEDETIETVIGHDLVKRLRDAGFPVPLWDR